MSKENLNEMIKSYERLKEYTDKFGGQGLKKLVLDFEEKFIPYLKRSFNNLAFGKGDSSRLLKGEKVMTKGNLRDYLGLLDGNRTEVSRLLLVAVLKEKARLKEEMWERLVKWLDKIHESKPHFWFYLGYMRTMEMALKSLCELTWIEEIRRSSEISRWYKTTPVGEGLLLEKERQIEEYLGTSLKNLEKIR